LEAGEDPVKALIYTKMQVRCEDEPSVYNFTSACPHCGHSGVIRVPTNLMINQTGLCGACFGGYMVDYQDIRKFIELEHRELQAD